MKKVYIKPIIAVEKLLIESQLMDHSNNRPQAKEGGVWGDDHTVITNGQFDNGNSGNNNLWED